MIDPLAPLAGYFDRRCGESSVGAYAASISTEMDTAKSELLYDELTTEFISILDIKPQDRVLDIGCATGDMLVRFGRVSDRVEGLDISEKMVLAAREKGLNASCYDGLNFPHPYGSFDKISLISVLINIPNQEIAERLILGALGLLKPGGMLLVGGVPERSRCAYPTYAEATPSLRARLSRRARGLLGLPLPAAPGVRFFSFEAEFFMRPKFAAQCTSVCFIQPEHASMRTGKMHVLFTRKASQ